jgi:hypothetical protein
MNKKLFASFLFLISLNLVFAQGCDSSGWKGNGKLFDNKTVSLTCPTCTFINITLTSPSGNKLISNDGMVFSGGEFSYTFLGSNLTEVGTYQIDGFSNLDEPLSLCFDITLNGKEQSVSAYIFLVLLLLFSLIGLVMLDRRFDDVKRESMYKKAIDNFLNFKLERSKSNLLNSLMSFIAYAMFKLLFIWYYIVGLLFLLILSEMVDSYSINTFQTLLPTILNIYLALSFVVMIGVLSIVLNILKDLFADASHMYRGVFE